jgi:hypothetical protein
VTNVPNARSEKVTTGRPGPPSDDVAAKVDPEDTEEEFWGGLAKATKRLDRAAAGPDRGSPRKWGRGRRGG